MSWPGGRPPTYERRRPEEGTLHRMVRENLRRLAASVEVMRGFFEELPSTLPARPRALLVVSAHWEAPVPTVMTSPNPPILYDYGGFPPEAYRIQWPAPGIRRWPPG